MTKPLKFHQTLNQAPRSIKHGQHRTADSQAHSRPIGGTDNGARRPDQGGTITWTTFNASSAFDFSEPKPPAIPYAGIRTGEIVGQRLWWVIDGQLCSLAHRRLWQPGETITGATNKTINQDWFSLSPPIWGGTYAFAERGQCQTEIKCLLLNIIAWNEYHSRSGHAWFGWLPYKETTTFVLGSVKLWGDVVEHEKGYRAEFAKLNSIDEIFGESPELLNDLRRRYGVH